MKIYDSVTDYLKEHTPGDRVVFEGHGIGSGLKRLRKGGTYRVTCGTTRITYQYELTMDEPN